MASLCDLWAVWLTLTTDSSRLLSMKLKSVIHPSTVAQAHLLALAFTSCVLDKRIISFSK